MRKTWVLGNWKLNNDSQAIRQWLEDFNQVEVPGNAVVGVAPVSIYSQHVAAQAPQNLLVGSQNVSQFDGGAYTGEVSATMLADARIAFSLVGHSERRMYFGETNEITKDKVNALLQTGIIPVLCCGESQVQYETGKSQSVVESQLRAVLDHVAAEDVAKLVIAYEPVWAIGTGLTATPEYAQQMHQFIRALVAEYSSSASDLPILYGGSCNGSNAKELFAQADIDGGLIGGASLKVSDFNKIIEAVR